MEFSIRLATETDLPSILEIVALTVPLLHATGNFQWDETYPNEEKFRYDLKNNYLWVCDVNSSTSTDVNAKQVVGMCAITMDQDPEYADCGWDTNVLSIVPHRLAIHPEFRRHGLAEKFMLHAEVVANTKGIKSMRVDTNVVNVAMQNLFKKLGYSYKGEVSLPCKKEGLRFCCYEKTLN